MTSYTLVLASASNAFVDASGNLLDGAGNGGHQNFTTTFSVTQPTLELSLPDFARGPGQTVTLPNDNGTGIPFQLSNQGATLQLVSTLTFQMPYNTNLLSVNGIVLGPMVPTDAVVTLNTTSIPGVALVGFTAGATPIAVPGNGGTFNLLDLTASVPTTAPYDGTEMLDLQNISLNGGTVSVADDGAIHVASYPGDTDNSALSANPQTTTYTAVDALNVLEAASGLATGYTGYPLVDPVVTSDIDFANGGQGVVNAVDALDILIAAGGNLAAVPNLPRVPTGVTPLPPGPDPRLQVGDASGAPGSLVLVPVTLDHSDGLDGVHLALSYDTSRLQLLSPSDVEPGNLTQDFDFHVNLDDNGTLPVDATSNSGDSGLAAGTVAVLAFQVRTDAPAGDTVINLRQQAGNTLTLLQGQDDQGQPFRFELVPTPADSIGDPLDGLVTVLTVQAPTLYKLQPADLGPAVPALSVASSMDADLAGGLSGRTQPGLLVNDFLREPHSGDGPIGDSADRFLQFYGADAGRPGGFVLAQAWPGWDRYLVAESNVSPADGALSPEIGPDWLPGQGGLAS